MKEKLFEGCATALLTPFTENGINFEATASLIEKQLKGGVKALVVLGTTGEHATTTYEERKALISFIAEKVNKRAKIIVGAGSNSTQIAINHAKEAERLGADGILLVTPYYNKCTQEGIYMHYETVCKSISIPVIAYCVPSRTGVNILPETAKKLSTIPNLVGLKEASGDLSQIIKIHKLCGDDLPIYSGNDDQIVSCYSCGGQGVISVLSNIFPEDTVKMCNLLKEGNFKDALHLQEKYLDFISSLFCEVNPIPVKYAAKYIGIDAGKPRLPLTELTNNGKRQVDEAISNLKENL